MLMKEGSFIGNFLMACSIGVCLSNVWAWSLFFLLVSFYFYFFTFKTI